MKIYIVVFGFVVLYFFGIFVKDFMMGFQFYLHI